MGLKAYLQLIRLPNVFTAAADSLAGWLLVTGDFDRPESWVPLVLASACTYAGGIALNDVFDAEVDRVERPSRPIPSGRISRRTAAILGTVLMVMGLGLAIASRTRWGWLVESILIGCVLLYDMTGKRTALGPEVMGACRSLNFFPGGMYGACGEPRQRDRSHGGVELWSFCDWGHLDQSKRGRNRKLAKHLPGSRSAVDGASWADVGIAALGKPFAAR